jgi:hypothetical protein
MIDLGTLKITNQTEEEMLDESGDDGVNISATERAKKSLPRNI